MFTVSSSQHKSSYTNRVVPSVGYTAVRSEEVERVYKFIIHADVNNIYSNIRS